MRANRGQGATHAIQDLGQDVGGGYSDPMRALAVELLLREVGFDVDGSSFCGLHLRSRRKMVVSKE